MPLPGLPARVLVLGMVLSAPAQSQARWPVDARPLLDIAGTADNGDVAFGSANWAVRLPNGGVVVADAGAPGLRFFDASGKFVRQSGRSGQGPGEMRTVTWVGHCGAGRVYAWDWTQFRLVEFDTAGTYHRMISVTATPTPFSVACSSTGVFAFLGIPQRKDMTQTAAGRTAGVVNGLSPFVLADSNGTATVTLGEYSPGELVAGAGAEGMRPLGRWTTFAVSSDRVYLGTAEAAAVERFDLSGRRQSSVSVPVTPRAPTKAMHEAAISDLLLMVPKRARAIARAQMADVPLPERLPPYRGVFADPLGLLWVVVTESGDPETRLLAFDQGGRLRAESVVPNGMRVFEVGRDYILGAREDADGEQHVQVWRLRRPAS